MDIVRRTDVPTYKSDQLVYFKKFSFFWFFYYFFNIFKYLFIKNIYLLIYTKKKKDSLSIIMHIYSSKNLWFNLVWWRYTHKRVGLKLKGKRKKRKRRREKQQKTESRKKVYRSKYPNMQSLRGNSCMELLPHSHNFTHSHVPRAHNPSSFTYYCPLAVP